MAYSNEDEMIDFNELLEKDDKSDDYVKSFEDDANEDDIEYD